uniref:Uncharacterized protein n=1 Tax=Solanum tuberosum TaxID=4113 RepID=M1D3K8_SOLTU
METGFFKVLNLEISAKHKVSVLTHCGFITTCSRRYRNANGDNLGTKNFFVVFGFSQPSPDLDEIKVFEVVPSAEGENRVGEINEQSVSRQTIPRCSTSSPKVTEPEFAEGQSRKAMNQTKGRIAEWVGDTD